MAKDKKIIVGKNLKAMKALFDQALQMCELNIRNSAENGRSFHCPYNLAMKSIIDLHEYQLHMDGCKDQHDADNSELN